MMTGIVELPKAHSPHLIVDINCNIQKPRLNTVNETLLESRLEAETESTKSPRRYHQEIKTSIAKSIPFFMFGIKDLESKSRTSSKLSINTLKPSEPNIRYCLLNGVYDYNNLIFDT